MISKTRVLFVKLLARPQKIALNQEYSSRFPEERGQGGPPIVFTIPYFLNVLRA